MRDHYHLYISVPSPPCLCYKHIHFLRGSLKIGFVIVQLIFSVEISQQLFDGLLLKFEHNFMVPRG